MPKKEKGKEIRFVVDGEFHKRVNIYAESRGESVAEICRRAVLNEMDQRAALEGIDTLLPIIRTAAKEALQPSIERFAKIEAKGSIASATAMYMLIQALHDMGKDAKKYYEEARKKAVVHLRAQEDIGEE